MGELVRPAGKPVLAHLAAVLVATLAGRARRVVADHPQDMPRLTRAAGR